MVMRTNPVALALAYSIRVSLAKHLRRFAANSDMMRASYKTWPAGLLLAIREPSLIDRSF